MADAIGNYLNGQFLGIANGRFAGGAIADDAGKLQGFRNPAAIIFPIELDVVPAGSAASLCGSKSCLLDPRQLLQQVPVLEAVLLGGEEGC